MSNAQRSFHVAIVGATGAVGETMLAILAERDFPVGTLSLLASERSAGGEIEFNGNKVRIQDLATFDPSGVDIALFSAGGSVSKEYAPKFAAAGAVVIDNSSAFRYDDDVPLVVSEVNPDQVANRPRGIIANPNCSTMQMLVALAPLHRKYGIERINVSTYQSVSGGGRSALEELGKQTGQLLSFQEIDPQRFPVQIAFNLIPHIDDFLDNGFTKEEMKLVWETRKILGDDSILVNPTAVRVPVFYGHSESVAIETRDKVTVAEARALLEQSPGIEVVDRHEAGGYPTPVTHASGNDAVYVGRIREDLSHPRGLNLWIVSDNVRKGAALNAVQLAELVAAEKR
ncbi:aspartate-semialdehyde dehydrogenase [Stenotrophomonas sp. SI-NJAU-1]|uniref:aspartate-semialdehyde dehydrogenase n=1 Tax=Stenotrophomonas sp. SI-NJAU-1 TaxID=2886359 RepID=UPI001E4CD771|nr:aspartate-semialdehyde dehydrogenase [Stenotrophomonas sp. SI-NJAU-1]UEX17127.1 aspartate-semialdehyde dehydrogenase [Stenotrophomonas sp. SI-NJAU-1]